MSISISKSSTPSNASKINISPHCHLDPVSYVKGDHSLTLENGVVVHPRTKLFTDSGPIMVREGSIISEKCTIGTLSGNDSTSSKPPLPGVTPPSAANLVTSMMPHHSTDEAEQEQNPKPSPHSDLSITIGKSVYIHPNVNLHPPCTISDYAILEAGITIMPGCTIGSHSKICAGIALPVGTVVPDWTVVYGLNGTMKRKRHRDLSEDARLEGMNRERIAAFNLLRTNAAVNKLATSGSSGAAGTSREKRQSVMLSEGFKT